MAYKKENIMTTENKTRQILCARCKIETRHQILLKHEENGEYEPDSISWWNSYQIVQCAGCDSVSFVHVHTDSESRDYETGQYEESLYVYPDRQPRQQDHNKREPIECVETFPLKTRRAYREVIRSLSANLPILTAIGIRAIIESVCIEQKASGRNLEKKIEDLATKGLLAAGQANILHGLRFMGNYAAHEIEPPKLEEILAALEIAETLLKTIYFLPSLANSIKSGRPAAKPPAAPPAK